MSDEHLRDLERRWRTSGDPQAEAAYLLARVRAGRLERSRLEVAAHLGHAAACAALDRLPPESEDDDAPDPDGAGDERPPVGFTAGDMDLLNWVLALREWDPLAPVRAGVAAARAVLDRFEREHPGEAEPREALDAAEACLRCPCPEHANAAFLASRSANAAAQRWQVQSTSETGHDQPRGTLAAMAAGHAALAAHWLGLPGPSRDPLRLRMADGFVSNCLSPARSAADAATLRAAIRAAFVPELLA